MTQPTQHPWSAATRRLQVHDVQVDLRYRRVIRPDGEAELPQRMFELLLVFLAEPQVLHSRADLFARVWPGVIVEDANLSQSIWMLRKALGEPRKHWIRTVAKSGYVFEPPGPVVVAPEPGPAPAAPISNVPPAAAETAKAAPEPAPPPPRRRRARWVAAALLAGAVVGGVSWWLHQRTPPSPPQAAATTPQLSIALIDVEDAAAPEDSRWPVTLLHAWLGWKLESLPEVTLLTEAHLAADSQGRSPKVVFLSSGVQGNDPDRVVLRARFDEGGRERRFEQKGTRAELPAMADRLSQQVLMALVPARAGESWPALAIDTAMARRYAEGVEALERRDWVASAKILQDVADRAPRFGLARMQLGHALWRLSRAAPAIEQTERAIELLQPVPADVAAVLHAERLARDPQRATEAAAAFAELARRRPDKTSYALDQARMLLRAGQFKETLAILNQPHWDQQPVGSRLAQRLNLASTHLSMGDTVRAREQALAAERLARAAGKGWEQELGEALLMAAQADAYQYEEKADLARYEQAAEQFELAGDDMGAMIARFNAESLKGGSATAGGMEALLLQARERGFRRLEIDILRVVAYRHYSAGDMPAYRARLEQALATALAAGDTYEQHLLEIDLLNEDFMRGRFRDADRRVASLRKSGLQGSEALMIAQYEAVIAANRGQFKVAEATLEQAIRRDREASPGEDASTSAARVSCLRADIRLVQGDMAGAGTNWKHCETTGQPSARLQGLLGRASIALLAGDRAATLKGLHEAEQATAGMPDGPDRWTTDFSVASLLTRAGGAAEAERIYRRILPLAKKSDYGWIIAIAEAGLAETAATRGDWRAVAEHVAAAREEDVAEVWTLSNRLDVLEAAVALAKGDVGRARQLLSEIHAKARSNGDVITQLEIYSLLPPGMGIGECNQRCQNALVAKTAMRGATLEWLTASSGLDTGALRRSQIR